MLDSTEDKILYAALQRARNIGGKEIIFNANGISVKDSFNVLHRLQFVEANEYSVEAVKASIMGFRYNIGSYDVRGISGFGDWKIESSDGGFLIKPKKALAPCVEAVIQTGHADFDFIRDYYATAGISVFLFVEGETRTKALAKAITAERFQAGLPTEFNPLPVYAGWNKELKESDIPEMFRSTTQKFPVWEVNEVEQKDVAPLVLKVKESEVPGKSIMVVSEARNEWDADRYLRAIGEMGGNIIGVSVTLEKSKPVVRSVLSKGLKLPKKLELPSSPWIAFRERREKAIKGRPEKPITWHQTTEAVAEAFIEQKAPRGFVSGRSLFFHGPVAYSIWNDNPISAIVDFKDGTKGIFYGRAKGIGGTKAGTVSSAQGDIYNAGRKAGNFREFHIDQLSDFITLKDLTLDEAAIKFVSKKNEDQYPKTCRIDVPLLRNWLLRKKVEADTELEEAQKATFPTFRKARAWGRLEALAQMVDDFGALFSTKMPDVGAASVYRDSRVKEYVAAVTRRDKTQGFIADNNLEGSSELRP